MNNTVGFATYEKVFQTLPNLYVLLSHDFYILDASDAFLEATRLQRQDIVERHIFKAFPDNYQTRQTNLVPNITHALQQVLSTGKPFYLARQQYNVLNLQHPNQFDVHFWRISLTPILDEKEQVQHIILQVINITEEVQAEEKLEISQKREKSAVAEAEHQRARMEKFLMEVPAGICVSTGKDFVYDFVNPSYQKQLFPGRNLLGKTLFEAVPEIVGQPIVEVLQQVMATGETSEGKEVLIPLAPADGKPLQDHYFNYIQQARYNEKGEVDGIMTFAYDITELVVARKKLEQVSAEQQILNDQLALTNLELRLANEELLFTQQALQQLNNELEARVEDRTEALRLAKAEAENQRVHLESLFMQAPAPIVILNGPDLIYDLVNPAYQNIFSDRQLLGKPILDALPEIRNTEISKILRHVYSTGESFVAQESSLWLARTEGGPLEESFWSFTYQARRNEHGQIDGIMVFAYEVTDQVIARRKVEENNRQLQTLFGNTPDIITRWDQELRMLFTNAAFKKTTGLEETTALGKTNLEIGMDPAVAVPWMNALREVVVSGKPKEYYNDYRSVTGDIYFHSRIVPEFDSSGAVQSVLAISRDITELKKAETTLQETAQALATANQELSRTNQELSRTNIDLDNFVYTASHDLKNPILNIEGLLIMLPDLLSAESRATGEVQHVLSMMQGAIIRFKKTIGDLTEIMKLQQNMIDEVTPIHLLEVVQEVILDIEPQIQSAQAELALHVNDCPTIPFSKKNLRSIVYNLLSNALKYRSPERRLQINISCRTESTYIVLDFKDNGLGMNLTEDSLLFSLFRRLHDHVEGSGIGLYMVKKIIENANGKIEVKSQEGVGSVFSVYFPRIIASTN